MPESRRGEANAGRSQVAAALAWYRFRATFSGRKGGYFSLALVIAIIGGVAMTSVEVGRRTQSSYPAYLAQTNASDLTLSVYGTGPAGATLYDPRVAAAIAHVPGVRHVESFFDVYAAPLKDGAPRLDLGNDLNFAASNTGLYFDQDRATPLQGRLPNPGRTNEFMTTPEGARLIGAHVGQVVPVGLYTPAQANLPGFGTAQVPPAIRVDMKLVGIVELNNEVVQDDADQLPAMVVYTPAFARLVPNSATFGTWYGIQLTSPAPNLAQVEQSLLRVMPPGAAANFSVKAVAESKVERALKPESIALGAFGLIALLAVIGTALPIIGRNIRSTEDDRKTLRALGAGPGSTLGDGLFGVLESIVLGSVGAAIVAAALSPLGPLGPIRRVYHPKGLALDWTVLGLGLVVLVGGLSSAAVFQALRTSPQRLARMATTESSRSSRVVAAAASQGFPLPGVVGLRFALEPGRGRTVVPVRSVLAGAVVAVLTVTATLVFGNSLRVLVTHPNLYGWNWNYTLMSQNGVPPQAQTALSHDPDVAAWSGYGDTDVQIDGQTVPALLAHGTSTVSPPLLSGKSPGSGTRAVVMGAATLKSLHKQVGDTVTISYGSPNTKPLYLAPLKAVITASATFPALAGSSTFADHVTMGTGVLIRVSDLPAAFVAGVQQSDPTVNGPSLVFVRLKSGLTTVAGLTDMNRIAAVADKAFAQDPNAVGDTVSVLSVQRPAEIVNYQSTGNTPELLSASLGAGAAIALALSLIATSRRRRGDLAVLKTLGCTRRQIAETLAWQATVTAIIGVVVGLPIGIAVGRQLWILFANNIDAVPKPAVPWSVVVVVIGTLILANAVALLPGRVAASTPAAVVLRQE